MNENNENKENVATEELKQVKKKGKKKKWLIILIILLVLIVGGGAAFILLNKDKKVEKVEKKEIVIDSEYKMSGNNLQEFDLFFLKQENKLSNKIYSPLSIKYALEMLSEGSDGETKAQIDSVIGKYIAKKYVNSSNLSLANALFVKDSFKDDVNEKYIDLLKDNYNASVIYDSFQNPNNVNKWVKSQTFDLISDLLDNINENDFILINALAIDMDWVNKIQSEHEDFSVSYKHEDFYTYVNALDSSGYSGLKFKDLDYEVKSVEIAATANRYDIVDDLKEENIRNTVKKEYSEFVSNKVCGDDYVYEDVDTYVNKFITDIDSNNGFVDSSTDFSFYVDSDIKVFAKDLKEYDGTTLQYVGIMPISKTLDTYVSEVTSKQINDTIDNLKDARKVESYADGKVTRLKGNIPMFKFDYQLDLMNDLKEIGIKDVFDSKKADLSKITKNKGEFIDKAVHKANIEFSNDGIKAAAATAVGGKGAVDCKYEHLYKVPEEEIDLTFDKPFMFLIRDKDTGEIWFIGTVYEPVKITDQDMGMMP